MKSTTRLDAAALDALLEYLRTEGGFLNLHVDPEDGEFTVACHFGAEEGGDPTLAAGAAYAVDTEPVRAIVEVVHQVVGEIAEDPQDRHTTLLDAMLNREQTGLYHNDPEFHSLVYTLSELIPEMVERFAQRDRMTDTGDGQP